ncbi:MAG: TIM barrel protein [Rhodobacteraceae bacterium]|nr:TIM barrel protein [Paracoccaceae bacterium]
MPRFSANISMMFTEHVFLDRFAAARAAGFDAVEFLFPYDHAANEIAAAVLENRLSVSVFNLACGDWNGAERGFAALAVRADEFAASVTQALPYAKAAKASRLHVMAGIAEPGRQNDACYVGNIQWAADRFAKAGLELLIEPINRRDMPGYFLSSTDQALRLMDRIDRPNVRLQLDLYHHQITHGDVLHRLEQIIGWIGHIQIAGVPDRGEPDYGELDYAPIFTALDRLGYDGWIGCEYRPRGRTVDGLGWLKTLV